VAWWAETPPGADEGLDDALGGAMSGAQIQLGPGRYRAVELPPGARVVGAGVGETEVFGHWRMGPGARVSDLRIHGTIEVGREGESPAGAAVELERIEVFEPDDAGLLVWSRVVARRLRVVRNVATNPDSAAIWSTGELDLEEAQLVGARGAGLFIAGGAARISDLVVTDSAPCEGNACSYAHGQGVRISGGEVELRRVVVRGATSAGLQVRGAFARVRVSDLAVHGLRRGLLGAAGVDINGASILDAERVVVTDTPHVGVRATSGAQVMLKQLYIQGAGTADVSGWSLVAENAATSVDVSDAVLLDTRGWAVSALTGAELTVRDLVVRGVRTDADRLDGKGRGVHAAFAGRVALERAEISDVAGLGVAVVEASCDLTDVLVRGVGEARGEAAGIAVAVAGGAVLERVRVEAIDGPGVIATHAASLLTARGLIVEHTAGPGVFADGATVRVDRGRVRRSRDQGYVAARRGHLRLRDVTASQVESEGPAAGVLVNHSTAELVSVEVHGLDGAGVVGLGHSARIGAFGLRLRDLPAGVDVDCTLGFGTAVVAAEGAEVELNETTLGALGCYGFLAAGSELGRATGGWVLGSARAVRCGPIELVRVCKPDEVVPWACGIDTVPPPWDGPLPRGVTAELSSDRSTDRGAE